MVVSRDTEQELTNTSETMSELEYDATGAVPLCNSLEDRKDESE
jgi:hypothetical protein